MRGDRPVPLKNLRFYCAVYPACAGIDLLHKVAGTGGDGFTPHARGSTSIRCNYSYGFIVYPACAGIDLVLELFGEADECLPRMRGDRPLGI